MSGNDRQTTQAETLAPPAELVHLLLREAGIHAAPESFSLLGDSTSNVWSASVGGHHYVVRHRTDDDEQMAHKEMYLNTLLHDLGVPAPTVLAMAIDEYGVGTLSTLLTGIRLDHAIETLTGDDLHSVWHATGEALRLAHEIVLSDAGEIVGDEIKPFPGGWGQWVLEDVVDDIGWLQTTLNCPKVNASRLAHVVTSAAAVLKDAPIRLVHNDALPQNVLVASGATGWRCVGWLDWEFARAADPLWDIGTLDFRPANLVTASFYAGYGVSPDEPQTSIYELLMAVWRTRAELAHGPDWQWPPQQACLAYLHNLPNNIDRLAGLLGVS